MQTVAWGAVDREIRVRIEDYSEIPAKVRSEALHLAESILRTAGAEVQWLQCSPIQRTNGPEVCNEARTARYLYAPHARTDGRQVGFSS